MLHRGGASRSVCAVPLTLIQSKASSFATDKVATRLHIVDKCVTLNHVLLYVLLCVMKPSPNGFEQGFLSTGLDTSLTMQFNFPNSKMFAFWSVRREKIAPFFVPLASPVLILSKFALKSALNRSNQRR
jgi:hypothetical protein